MKKLYTLTVTHYAPKDSHEAIEAYLIADREEEILPHADKYGSRFEGAEEICADLGVTKAELARARQLGLEVSTETWGVTISGDPELIFLWNRGDYDEDFDDAYYGVTHYAWDEGAEITDDDVDTLLRLGVAKLA